MPKVTNRCGYCGKPLTFGEYCDDSCKKLAEEDRTAEECKHKSGIMARLESSVEQKKMGPSDKFVVKYKCPHCDYVGRFNSYEGSPGKNILCYSCRAEMSTSCGERVEIGSPEDNEFTDAKPEGAGDYLSLKKDELAKLVKLCDEYFEVINDEWGDLPASEAQLIDHFKLMLGQDGKGFTMKYVCPACDFRGSLETYEGNTGTRIICEGCSHSMSMRRYGRRVG